MRSANLSTDTKVYRRGTAGEEIVSYIEGIDPNGTLPSRKQISDETGHSYFLVSAYLGRLRDYPGVPDEYRELAIKLLTTKHGKPSRMKQATVKPSNPSPEALGEMSPKAAYELAVSLTGQGVKPSLDLVVKANRYAKRAKGVDLLEVPAA